jgi:hypothetical protein
MPGTTRKDTKHRHYLLPDRVQQNPSVVAGKDQAASSSGSVLRSPRSSQSLVEPASPPPHAAQSSAYEGNTERSLRPQPLASEGTAPPPPHTAATSTVVSPRAALAPLSVSAKGAPVPAHGVRSLTQLVGSCFQTLLLDILAVRAKFTYTMSVLTRSSFLEFHRFFCCPDVSISSNNIHMLQSGKKALPVRRSRFGPLDSR